MSGTPPKSTGAALVLGGGVAGIQCSLDLAEGGYKVYLVERAPALGGHMAQLDKTFPTNDCSMCTLAPKLVEASRHLEHRDHHELRAHRSRGRARSLQGEGLPPRPLRGPRSLHELQRLRPGVSRHRQGQVQRGAGRAQGHLQALSAGHPQHLRRRQAGLRSLQERLRRADLGPGLRRPDPRGPLRRRLSGGRGAQPLPVGVWPHLRPRLRDRVHARQGRRADRHRQPQALRLRRRRPHRTAGEAAGAAPGEGRHRRRGPHRHVGAPATSRSTATRPRCSRRSPSPAACCASASPTTACRTRCCRARSIRSARSASTCASTSAAASISRSTRCSPATTRPCSSASDSRRVCPPP